MEVEDGRIQRLSHDLFDDDAIILKDMCREVALKSMGHQAMTVVIPRWIIWAYGTGLKQILMSALSHGHPASRHVGCNWKEQSIRLSRYNWEQGRVQKHLSISLC